MCDDSEGVAEIRLVDNGRQDPRQIDAVVAVDSTSDGGAERKDARLNHSTALSALMRTSSRGCAWRQIFMPSALATVNRSLSPRPHRFITMMWSFGSFGAIFAT